jgi:hypothetical protein
MKVFLCTMIAAVSNRCIADWQRTATAAVSAMLYAWMSTHCEHGHDARLCILVPFSSNDCVLRATAGGVHDEPAV